MSTGLRPSMFPNGGSQKLLHLLVLVLVMAMPVFNVAVQTGSAAAAGANAATAASGTVPVLVKFKPVATQADIAGAVQASGGQDVRSLTQIRTHIINVPAGAAAQVVAALSRRPNVEHAAQAIKLTKASMPNDPGYPQQWALPKMAWDQAYGSVTPSGKATIAVLDTGVDASHPDLAGRMTAGNSFVAGDPNTDPNGHGTELAGIAAAAVNNGTGMAGVDYAGAGISSVQVLQPDGTGYDGDVSSGVLWAADNGANVILMGLSSPDYSSTLADAVAYAESKGVVVVAAAGNDGSSASTYPAALPGVIGVASTNQSDALSSFSNTGSAAVAAPGEGIYATQPGGRYGTVTGTSPAAAEVAGLAGLLIANGDTATQTANQITGETDPISGRSFGRVNVEKALTGTAAVPSTSPRPAPTPGAAPPVYSSNTLVPNNGISVTDQTFNDWAGVSSYYGDPASDAGSGAGTGPDDIRRVWLANDQNNLYVRWDVQLGTNSQTTNITSSTFAIVVDQNGGSNPTAYGFVSFDSHGNVSYLVQTKSGSTFSTVPATGVGAEQSCSFTPNPCGPGMNASVEAVFPMTTLALTPGSTIGVWTETLASPAYNSDVKDRAPNLGSAYYQVQTSTGGGGLVGTGPIVNISKAPMSSTVPAGGADTYTITLKNVGSPFTSNAGDTTGNASITSIADTLPSGFSYGGGLTTSSGFSASTSASSGATGTVTFTSGSTLAPGQSATLSFNVTASSTAGTYYNDAVLTYPAYTASSCAAPPNPPCSTTPISEDTGPVAPVTVQGAGGATPTQLAVGTASGPFNSTADFTATLTAGPSNPVDGQTITFALNGATVGTAVTGANGVATLTGVSLVQNGAPIGVGSYPGAVTASYAGTASGVTPTYGGSNGFAGLTVTKRSTGTTVTCSPSPVGVNTNTSCTVSVSDSDTGTAGMPTGSVSFDDGGAGGTFSATSCTLASGSCSVSYKNATASSPTYGITGTYGGDGTHLGSSNTFNLTVSSLLTLTVSMAGIGSGTVTSSPTGINCGSTCSAGFGAGSMVTLTASAGSNSTFNGWSGGNGTLNGDGTYTVTMDAATTVTATFKANQAPLTITSPTSGTYGQAYTLVTSGGSGTGAVTFDVGSSTACTIPTTGPNAGMLVITSGTGTCVVTATKAGDANYNSTTSDPLSVTVGKASQTINFTSTAPASAVYNDQYAPAATATSGLPVSFDATGACSYDSTTGKVTMTGIGTCTVTASQGGDDNYSAATSVSQQFTVGQASQTISFGPLSTQTYGTGDFTVSATASSGLPVSFTASGPCTVSLDSSTGVWTVHITGIGTGVNGCTITASQGGNTDYSAAPSVPQSFDIAPVTPIFTFDLSSLTKTYGDPSYSVAGYAYTNSTGAITFSLGDGSVGCSVTPDGQVTITGAAVDPDSCIIKATLAADGDFAAAGPISQSFHIARASQATLTITSPTSGTYGQSYPIGTSGGSGTGALSFDAGSSTACAIGTGASAGMLMVTSGTGTCVITATQAADANYNSTTSAPFTVTVNQASQTITFGSLSNKTFGDPDFTVSATASSGLPVSFSVGSTDQCTISQTAGVWTVHLTGVGSCTVTASQSGDSNYSPASSVPQTFTILQAGTVTSSVIVNTTNGNPNPQFSDSVTLTASVSTTPANGVFSGTLAFTVNGTSVGAPQPVSNTSPSSSVTVKLDNVLLPNGAGSYGVSATFTPAIGSNYTGSSSPTQSFSVNAEGELTTGSADGSATITYTGDPYVVVNTAPNMVVTLNQSQAPETGDTEYVDFSKVKVQANVAIYPANATTTSGTGTPAWTGTYTIANRGDWGTTGTGYASFSGPKLAEGSYIVCVSIVTTGSGAYSYIHAERSCDSTLDLASATGSFITGGGRVAHDSTANGANPKGNFGFNAKMANHSLQGNSIYVYRMRINTQTSSATTGFVPCATISSTCRDVDITIRSNKLTGLYTGTTTTYPMTGYATGQMVVQVYDSGSNTEYTNLEFGGGTFRLDITDNTSGGQTDTYGFTAYRKDGTVFHQAVLGSNPQNGTGSPTNQFTLGSGNGNVTVHPK